VFIPETIGLSGNKLGGELALDRGNRVKFQSADSFWGRRPRRC